MSQSIRRFILSALPAIAVFLSAALAPSTADAHPLFSRDFNEQRIEEMRKSVAYFLAMPDEELRALVPAKSAGIRFTDCPNCDFGLDDQGRFKWTPEAPNRIICKDCDTAYPDNIQYPDDKYVEVEAPVGTHQFHYWENPRTGHRFFFRAHADYLNLRHLESAARDAGRLYSATGVDDYANLAGLLLLSIADVIPGYAYTFDFPYRKKMFSSYANNRILGVPDHQLSLWTCPDRGGISIPLLEAFDHLSGWDGWDAVGGEAAIKTIRNNLFTLPVEFVLGFEGSPADISFKIWRGAIYAGRILDRPEWVHESIRRFERMLNKQLLHDGHWNDASPSYHAFAISGMREVIAAAAGHSDPEGYRDPKTGRRFDNLDLERVVPQYRLAMLANEQTRLPDGRLLPVNSTWASQAKASRERLLPRSQSESFLMPGLGVAILGTGSGENQLFSWLNFTSGKTNKHRDALSIGLFSHGQEILSDIGHTNTRYRSSWASSTMSHNTVVVDGMESELDEDHSGNRIVAFATNNRNFHLAAAESRVAYAGITERYRRTLMLIGEGASNGYLLDIFEVKGGDQHDYLLHGSADADSFADLTGADLRPFAGTLVNPGAIFSWPSTGDDDMGPEGAYAFIRNLRRGPATGMISLDLRFEQSPGIGSRTIMAPLEGAEVFLGRSPSIRRANEIDSSLDDYLMPSMVVRRKGTDLDTIFVAAHEAVDMFPRLQQILTRRDGGRLWISITHSRGRDYVSIALDEPVEASFETSMGTFRTDAAYALVRLDRNDAIVSSHLVEGRDLQFRNHRLSGTGTFRGSILKVTGHEAGNTVFHLDQNPVARQPGILIVGFRDGSSIVYNVERIEPAIIGARVHVREALGFEIKNNDIRHPAHAERVIEGHVLSYRLIDSAHSN